MTKPLLPMGSDWTFPKIEQFNTHIERIGKEYLGIDCYPNQIEIIGAEQMLDAYSSVGMPISYPHWSFGKSFIENKTQYDKGQMGLAYEIVINSNPCIEYLMEENTMPMQALVLAHAGVGHNAVFKNNYLFKQFTDASSIIDYLMFARDFVRECEERYGYEKVENLFDAAHALANYGVDQYTKPEQLSKADQKVANQESEDFTRRQRNELWDTTVPKKTLSDASQEGYFPSEPEDNFLYFFEKYSPVLEEWERECLRIVRKMQQYFHPQRLTKTLNEGFATVTHFNIMNRMYDENLIDESFMLEFLHSHTGVIKQPDFDSPYYSGWNPYALGFAMFQDIRRICEEPTDEDELWFPDLVGQDWKKQQIFAMENFKDESFVQQYLSPEVIRKFGMFNIQDDSRNKFVSVADIHDEDGYFGVREQLASQYNLANGTPQLSILDANIKTNRTLVIQHQMINGVFLNDKVARNMFAHVKRLWGFEVEIVGLSEDGDVLEHLSSSD